MFSVEHVLYRICPLQNMFSVEHSCYSKCAVHVSHGRCKRMSSGRQRMRAAHVLHDLVEQERVQGLKFRFRV